MKKIFLSLLCLLLLMAGVGLLERIAHGSVGVRAQTDNQTAEAAEAAQNKQNMKRSLNEKQLARIQRREQKHQEFAHFIDSLILSRSYRFNPYSFSQEPAGSPHQIYNPNVDLTVNKDYFDISLPYIKGVVPPFQIVMLNYISYDMRNYTAEQTTNGWTISFSSSLFGANTYRFVFKVYSSSGMANLEISTPMYNTVSYSGSLHGLN